MSERQGVRGTASPPAGAKGGDTTVPHEAVVAGWGNYPTLRTVIERPRDAADATALLARHSSFIARGNGRSYGDSALNPSGVASTLAMNGVHRFDPSTGRITCEAGLLLVELLALVVPQGWFVPVTPGTRHVTLGGMLAANVHGKRLDAPGFGAHVESFTLLLASGERVHVDRTASPQLFRATVGGMGLTGVVLDLTFDLVPIESAWLVRETRAAPTLEHLLELFEMSSGWPYAVAWFDCLARGAARGRGLLHRGRHATAADFPKPCDAPLRSPARATRRVPFFLPDRTLNTLTIRAFNEVYYRLGRRSSGRELVDYVKFFYPLDNLAEWNRIYGRRGFLQYQCILPKATGRNGLAALLERIAAAGRGSFLAVLKRLGADDSGFLAFPLEGYTLALDFPRAPGVFALLDELDRIVLRHGGRLYLAKDARMSPAVFAAGYPELAAFQRVRDSVDPSRRFASLQSVRLGL